MRVRARFWFTPLALLIAVGWAYWQTLGEVANRWAADPQYSHGYLVPVFSMFLLWFRRSMISQRVFSSNWWGIAIAAAGVGLCSAGTYFFVTWFAEISLLLCLAGLAVTAGGWPALRWSWQSIVFLGFMIPLPYSLQTALGGGLKRVATAMSTIALQIFGVPAIKEGNIILINDVKVGVVDACNGLGMLVTFFALSAAIALLMRSADWWQRLAILISAVPVAILANVARITATGLLYNAAQDRLARIVFHDVAGWLMMPLAIALLFLELHVLKRLVVDAAPTAVDKRTLLGVARPTPQLAAK